jgi:hypothetical protein
MPGGRARYDRGPAGGAVTPACPKEWTDRRVKSDQIVLLTTSPTAAPLPLPRPVLEPRPVRTRTGGRDAAGRRRAHSRRLALEQLAFDLGPERPRWSFSRLVLRSPHRQRILERVEFVRRFFPELDGSTVRLGLAQKPGVLGWGSMDPEQPGIWVRPRRLDYFTVAHEFTHLLQARRLVPMGERQCDLHALARSAMLVDVAPGYLSVPRALRARRRLTANQSAFLCETARHALAARAAGERRYLLRFEREVAAAWRDGRLEGRPRALPVRAAVETLRLGLEHVRARIRAVAESLP